MSAPAVERADFAVAFDGEALREHRMSVRELAPALLSLADLFQAANEVVNPGEPQVSLDIQANREGSFLIHLQAAYEFAADTLTSRAANALSQLIGYIGSGSGLYAWIKFKRFGGQEQPNGSVRITEPDGTTIEFPPEVIRLAADPTVRRHASNAVAPVGREGIDRFEIRPDPEGHATVRVETDDLDAVVDFTTPDTGVVITDVTLEQTLTIASLNFRAGKWRLSDGETTRWMAMDDSKFLGRIDRNEESFTKNDKLRANVRMLQWESADGAITTEWSVTEVIRHIHGPIQQQLPPAT